MLKIIHAKLKKKRALTLRARNGGGREKGSFEFGGRFEKREEAAINGELSLISKKYW